MTKRALCAVALAVSLGACGPSINPQTKAAVDAWKAQLQSGSRAYPGVGLQRPALVAGQWVQYLVTDADGNPSQLTYKVLGEERGGIWFETETLDYSHHNVSKFLLVVGDWSNPDTFEFKDMVVQNDDEQAQQMAPFMLGMMSKPFRSWLVQSTTTTDIAQENVQVAAGTFEQAGRFDQRTETAFGTFEATTWIHGAVPVTGMVKSTSKKGDYQSELVAFGESGATSAIKGEPVPFGVPVR